MAPIEVTPMEPCPFCEYLAGRTKCAFVSRGERVSAFMNRAQYERGALLLVPNMHVESMLEMDADLVADLYREAHRLASVLVPLLGANGLGVYQNNGTSAGQTVPHFHVHVIPRYATSDPLRRFKDEDFPETGFEELERLAALIRFK